MADHVCTTAAQITSALTNAVMGDRIICTKNVIFTAPSGGWTLGVKTGFTGANHIEITTSETVGLPNGTTRTGLGFSTKLPKFQPTQLSGNTNDPSFKTAPGAVGWKFTHCEFLQSLWGSDTMVKLGANDSTQVLKAQEPQGFIVDRCLFNASINPVWSQKRGLQLHASNVVEKNNAFVGFDAPMTGGDGQCIWSINCEGNILHQNSMYEGATESMIYGGDDIKRKSIATVDASPAPTESSQTMTVTNAGDAPIVGQVVATVHNGGTLVFHPVVLTVSSPGANRYSITFTPIVAVTGGSTNAIADVGGDCRWGATPTGITVDGCYFRQPLSWRDSQEIIPTPAGIGASAGTGGALVAGSYKASVSAEARSQGGTYITSSGLLTPIDVTVAASGKIDVNWTAVPFAERYRIDVLHPDGLWRHFLVVGQAATGGSYVANGTLNSTIYTGSNKIPVGTKHRGKTLLEFKAARNVVVKNCVFDQHSPLTDIGYCWWIKSCNQNAASFGSPFVWSANHEYKNNIIRHVSGWILLSGTEHEARELGFPNPQTKRPKQFDGLSIHDNLIFDSGGLPNNLNVASIGAVYLANGGKNVSIHHNTTLHNQTAALLLASSTQMDSYLENFSFHSNLTRTNNYGIKGNNNVSLAIGAAALEAHCRGYLVTENAFDNNGGLTAGDIASYPPANDFYTTVNFKALFTAYDAGDYSLAAGSPALTGGLAGTRQGADIATTLLNTANVVSGTATATNPTIVTVSPLPSGTVGVVYSVTIIATDGTTPYTYAVTSGALPAGLTLNANTGAIGGSPSGSPGTASFSITVTDSAAHSSAPKAFTLLVAAAPASLSIVPGSLPPAHISSPYSAVLAATGGALPYSWELDAASGPLPEGLTLLQIGEITGTAIKSETKSIIARVRDAAGGSAVQTLTVSVSTQAYTFSFTDLADAALAWKLPATSFPTISSMLGAVLQQFVDGVIAEYDNAELNTINPEYVKSSLTIRREVKRDLGLPTT